MNERFKDIKSISDIVDTMIRGLKRRWVGISMLTFGSVTDGVCFGCAATNTLCEIMGEPFNYSEIYPLYARAEKFNFGITPSELHSFEGAIDSLRQGEVRIFWEYLLEIKNVFSFEIPALSDIIPPFELSTMRTGNWEEVLPEYEKYRGWLREKGL